MATKTKTRKTRTVTPAAAAKAEEKAAAKQARTADLKAQLDAWLAEVDEDEIADAIGTFRDYSERNACLIRMQDPDATVVHSYLDWLDQGRQIRPREGDGDGDGITIVGFRGNGQSKEQREQAEVAEAAKQPGEISSDDLKRKRNFYDLRLVYDVRHTTAVKCRECGEAIHRTGFAPDSKRFHTWTHTTVKAAHTALPVPRAKAGETAGATA